MFDSLRPRQPVSVAALKALAEQAARSRPATAQGNAAAPMYGAGGAAFQVPDNNWFLARIEDVSGSGTSAKYAFTEINAVAGTGGDEDRVSGRANDVDNDPARDPSGAAHEEDDIVLVRRNVANPGEWEVFAPAGSGSQPPEGGCTGKLGWLRDKASIVADKGGLRAAVRLTVVEALGRCACVDSGQDILMVWDADADHFAGWANFEACCGCGYVTLALNSAASLLLQIPTFTFSVTEGCLSGTSFTLVADPECGDDGVLQLAGFSTNFCDDELEDPPDCTNVVRVRVECVECDQPAVGCNACAGKLGPAVWKADFGGALVFYLPAGAGCGCSWSMTCGDYAVTVAVGATTITVTYADADGSATYVYDTNTATPGEDNPPECLSEHTISRTTGTDPRPASVAITPLSCDAAGESAAPCTQVEEGASLWVTIVGSHCSDGTYEFAEVPASSPRQWQPTTSVFGTGSSPNATCNVSIGPELVCEDDELAFSYPTTYAVFPDVCAEPEVVVLPVTSGVRAVFTICPFAFGWQDSGPVTVVVCDTAESCVVPELYFCVDDGTGVLTCTQAAEEPDGAAAGPFATAAMCAAACACADGSFTPMMTAPEGEGFAAPEGEVMAMGATAARRVPLSMRKAPCAHRGAATGETIACDSCGGRKAAAVYGCGVHGECTTDRRAFRDGKADAELPWCRTCPAYQSSTA